MLTSCEEHAIYMSRTDGADGSTGPVLITLNLDYIEPLEYDQMTSAVARRLGDELVAAADFADAQSAPAARGRDVEPRPFGEHS